MKFRFTPGRRNDRTVVPRDDPVGTDRAGRTALHYAVIDDPVGLNYTAALKDPQLAAENFRIGNQFRIENTTRLIALAADVNAVDNVGMTPLHFAAQSDSVEIVKILLEANANVNAVAEDGCTPLYRAVRNTTGKRADIVAVLMAAGADPTIDDGNGPAVLRFIARVGDTQLRDVMAEYGYPPV
ncbi:ankyrin repeat domain-containing protein [Mycobacterium sp. NPDC049093]